MSSESSTGFLKGVFATIATIAALVAIYEFILKNQISPSTTPSITTSCGSYGIKITSPQRGAYLVGQEFDVFGSFAVEPPKDSLWLIYASLDGRTYWPQFVVETESVRKTWKGKFIIGGDQYVTTEIVVAVVGKSGQVLFDYFKKVGLETGTYPAIERLTDDVVVCDSITVTRTKPK